MAQRILIVEDDPSILRGLELNFQLDGFEILTATDGRTAIEITAAGRVDLVVLDIMLPQVNGYQVIEALRARGDDVPIVLLSAKNAEMDIVFGLGLGADDYVTKPFKVGELLARVKAHLRRRAPSEKVAFGDVEIAMDTHVVRRAGQVVELTSKELALLLFLIEREGKALTRDTILHALWGANYFGTDRTVDNFITRLRQKLDLSGDPRHIQTVRGVGYRFVLDPDG